MCHLGFVGMCGYFLPNCAFLFLLKSKFKKQMNNQTYRDRDRGEWHNISLELSRQHRRLHRKTKGDVPDFTTRDNKLFPNLKKKKKSCSDLHNSFLCSVGRSAHRRYVPIVMCALAPGKLPVAPVLSYAETKHLRWAWYSSIHYIFKQFPWITYLVHSVKKNKQPTLFLGPVMRWAIWDKHKNLDMESYNLWAKINKYAT